MRCCFGRCGPEHPGALEVIEACGFDYKTAGFLWVKTNPGIEVVTLTGKGLFTGMGYATRSNSEACLLTTRGSPLRLSADVHQIVIAPVAEHSEKPDLLFAPGDRMPHGFCPCDLESENNRAACLRSPWTFQLPRQPRARAPRRRRRSGSNARASPGDDGGDGDGPPSPSPRNSSPSPHNSARASS